MLIYSIRNTSLERGGFRGKCEQVGVLRVSEKVQPHTNFLRVVSFHVMRERKSRRGIFVTYRFTSGSEGTVVFASRPK